MKTIYENILFRSHLETLWARRFDEDHLSWEYEPKTFREGRFSYTPDYLLAGVLWVEVKGDGVKMNPSLRLCPRPLLILLGSPRVHTVVLALPTRLIRFPYWEAAIETALKTTGSAA